MRKGVVMGRESIKVVNGALDTAGSDVVLRGVLDPQSLKLIKVDDYQREVLPITSLSSLVKAFANKASKVPDVTLGARGGNFTEREGAFYLQDDVYVADGLQRISAAMHSMRSNANLAPHLGAVVYFNTSRASEMELFRILNVRRLKLSPNVLVRNMRESNAAVNVLYGLTFDRSWILYDRVCWTQRMRRNELITAVTLLKVVGSLHSTFGPGLSTGVEDLSAAVAKTMDSVGRAAMRENVRTFFDAIDEAWGVRSVSFKEGAVYLRNTFLYSLSLVLAHHQNFWKGSKLYIPLDLRKKLSTFPVADPSVQGLAGAHGSARMMLYQLLVNHLNSGRRVGRLRPFREVDPISMTPDADEIVEEPVESYEDPA